MPRIEGRVVGTSGEPVENATITIPTAGVFALSDENGSFAIENVPPGIQTMFVVHRHYQKFGGDVHLDGDMFVTLEMDRQ